MGLPPAGPVTAHRVTQLLEGHLRDLDDRIRVPRRTGEKPVDLTERATSVDPAECTNPNRCQTIAPTSSAGATAQVHTVPHRLRDT